MRSIEEQTHQATGQSSGNGNGHDPSKQQKSDTLEVDCPEGTIAETHANGGTGDTHGGRDGEGVLREDKDGNGSTHFHGGTTAGRVVGDLVTHDYKRLLVVVLFLPHYQEMEDLTHPS